MISILEKEWMEAIIKYLENGMMPSEGSLSQVVIKHTRKLGLHKVRIPNKKRGIFN